MTNVLQDRLAAQGFLLADGATGTNLFARGLAQGEPPEPWNVEHPERVHALHDHFVRAGADLILTNSFGGNRCRLKLHSMTDRVAELNHAAARRAREIADDAEREVLVAGSMGPTGDLFEPLGPLDHATGVEVYTEQAEALAEGGCDVLWLETLSSPDELAAGMQAAASTGLPVIACLSFDTNGRTMMGMTPAELSEWSAAAAPAGFGLNCGAGASDAVVALMEMAASAPADAVLVAKANCGVPAYVDGKVRYAGTPALMAEYATLARDAGARVIGGCCGTEAAHLAAMRAALDAHTPGSPPSVDTVTAALGPLTGVRNEAPAPPRARRRRRATGP